MTSSSRRRPSFGIGTVGAGCSSRGPIEPCGLRVAVVVDLLLISVLLVALYVGLTGGAVFNLAGHALRVNTSGNSLAAFAVLALARYLWLGNVPFLLRGEPARAAIDRVVDSLVTRLRGGPDVDISTTRRVMWTVASISLALRLDNAAFHPGFVTGDDVEIHEMTFNALFHQHWPIWELRNPLYPMTFIYPVQRLITGLGLTDTASLVTGARVWVALISSATIWLAYRITLKLSGNRAAAIMAAALIATSHLYLSFASSELPRPVATVFILGAFSLLLDGGAWRAAAAGILIGVGGSLRFGELVFVAPVSRPVRRSGVAYPPS